LIGEEYPFRTGSRVCAVAKRLDILYLQIDLYREEWAVHNIGKEMTVRERILQGYDVRLSHADAVREQLWLERIEASLDRGRVLVIFG